ncbi:endocuticle structural glycoprotein SgAbd-5-like [Zerene cesonia]|uniref:endocuticle structural glycoprotein SgAbd-5-like n=1 Tax=Zerene cesonia TaxID=33412 RepID=UPI0018E5876F|nr:endocuticle structural glycoprotein SgAbd-5-like [Zerene cesonia]
MSSKLFLFGLLCVVLAAAQEPKERAEILTEKAFVRANGYDFEFKTSDGVSRKEQANLITVGDHQGIGVSGSYSYTAPDGQQYEVNFTADDKGFRPEIRVVPQNPQ